VHNAAALAGPRSAHAIPDTPLVGDEAHRPDPHRRRLDLPAQIPKRAGKRRPAAAGNHAGFARRLTPAAAEGKEGGRREGLTGKRRSPRSPAGTTRSEPFFRKWPIDFNFPKYNFSESFITSGF
jgi:hypothetical protein